MPSIFSDYACSSSTWMDMIARKKVFGEWTLSAGIGINRLKPPVVFLGERQERRVEVRYDDPLVVVMKPHGLIDSVRLSYLREHPEYFTTTNPRAYVLDTVYAETLAVNVFIPQSPFEYYVGFGKNECFSIGFRGYYASHGSVVFSGSDEISSTSSIMQRFDFGFINKIAEHALEASLGIAPFSYQARLNTYPERIAATAGFRKQHSWFGDFRGIYHISDKWGDLMPVYRFDNIHINYVDQFNSYMAIAYKNDLSFGSLFGGVSYTHFQSSDSSFILDNSLRSAIFRYFGLSKQDEWHLQGGYEKDVLSERLWLRGGFKYVLYRRSTLDQWYPSGVKAQTIHSDYANRWYHSVFPFVTENALGAGAGVRFWRVCRADMAVSFIREFGTLVSLSCLIARQGSG